MPVQFEKWINDQFFVIPGKNLKNCPLKKLDPESSKSYDIQKVALKMVPPTLVMKRS